ncbi:MAG: response regulator [Fibrobacterales bacterium]
MEKTKANRTALFTGLCIVVIGICASFVAGYLLEAHEVERNSHVFREGAEKQATNIINDLNSRIKALNRMGSRKENDKGVSKKEFYSDVRNYIEDMPGFQAIEWVDENYIVQWVIPLKGNEQAQGLDLAFEKRRKDALAKARLSKTATVTKPIDLVQGGKGFLVYIPLHVDSTFSGFILAVFQTEKWLSSILKSRIGKSYYTEVYIDNEKVYSGDNSDQAAVNYSQTISIESEGNRVFKIVTTPTQHYVSNIHSFIPELSTLFGIVLSILVGIIVLILKKTLLLNTVVRMSNTDLNNKQVELLEINEQLETASSIANSMTAEAEMSSIAKSEFLANMSHDIRTPMNGVTCMAELLLASDITAQQKKYLSIIKKSGESLVSLINDILDFSKIEAGKLEIDPFPFDLHELVQSFIDSMMYRADEKKISLTYSIESAVPQYINSDPNRIRQILINLVGNAFKFTDKGGIILAITKVAVDKDTCTLNFDITDTGIGIPKSKLKILFDKFSQVDKEITRNYGGTGLGLAISKQLSEMLGGGVSVESIEGSGATFSFSIVVQHADKSELVSANEENTFAEIPLDKRGYFDLLVVEDDITNRMIIQAVLQKLGYSADEAYDGVDALEKMAIKKYDMVFMDMQMPRLNGYKTTQKIRTFSDQVSSSEVPIVAMTANAMKQDRDECFEAGMNDYIAKPISITSVNTALNQWLSKLT